MLDAMYKDRYFDADKKEGLREMLHIAGQHGNGHSDSAHRGRGHGQTDRAETSQLDMYDEILVENETTEQRNSTASK